MMGWFYAAFCVVLGVVLARTVMTTLPSEKLDGVAVLCWMLGILFLMMFIGETKND